MRITCDVKAPFRAIITNDTDFGSGYIPKNVRRCPLMVKAALQMPPWLMSLRRGPHSWCEQLQIDLDVFRI